MCQMSHKPGLPSCLIISLTRKLPSFTFTCFPSQSSIPHWPVETLLAKEKVSFEALPPQCTQPLSHDSLRSWMRLLSESKTWELKLSSYHFVSKSPTLYFVLLQMLHMGQGVRPDWPKTWLTSRPRYWCWEVVVRVTLAKCRRGNCQKVVRGRGTRHWTPGDIKSDVVKHPLHEDKDLNKIGCSWCCFIKSHLLADIFLIKLQSSEIQIFDSVCMMKERTDG